MPKAPSDFLIEQSPAPRYDAPPRIDESVLCLGDCQIPYHDAKFINHCADVASAFGVTTALWVGDAFDFHALGIFLSQNKDALSKEIEQDRKYGEQLANRFARVLWTNGNHEDRLSRMLAQYLKLEQTKTLFGLPKHVETSDYYFCEIGDDWIATHPKNASVIPGRVPSMLALKYRKNVLSFHGHLVGACQINGLWAIDVGVTCDPMRLEYPNVRHNTRPMMQRGAVLMLKDSHGKFRPRILNELTDFDFEMKAGEIWRKRQNTLRRAT